MVQALNNSESQLLPAPPKGIMKIKDQYGDPNKSSIQSPSNANYDSQKKMLNDPTPRDLNASIANSTSKRRTQLPGQKKSKRGNTRPGVTSGPKPLNPDLNDQQKKDYWIDHQKAQVGEKE